MPAGTLAVIHTRVFPQVNGDVKFADVRR